MGRQTSFGGKFMLNKKMLNENWRPNLPRRFVRAYPKLNALILECWKNDPKVRPDFGEIVKRMIEIREEVNNVDEPTVVLVQ